MRFFYIAHFDCTTNTGNAAHVRGVINALVDQGHQVTLFAKAWNSEPGRPVVFVPVSQSSRARLYALTFALACLPVLIWHLLRSRPDVVYSRYFSTLFLLGWGCKMLGVPYVVELNADVAAEHIAYRRRRAQQMVWTWSEDAAYASAAGLVTVTEAIAESVRRRFPRVTTPMIVIENGVDSQVFSPQDKLECRQQLALNLEGPYLVYAGSFHIWQGISTIIDAAPAVLSAYPATKFILIGGSTTEVERVSITIGERNLKDHVIALTGQPPSVAAAYIGAADVCLAPYSHWAGVSGDVNVRYGDPMKGSPLKIFTYMACARPVVASHFQEAGVFVAESEAGVAIPPDDPVALSQAIVTLLRDPLHSLRLGEAGAAKVRRDHSWHAVSAKTVGFLSSILAHTP